MPNILLMILCCVSFNCVCSFVSRMDPMDWLLLYSLLKRACISHSKTKTKKKWNKSWYCKKESHCYHLYTDDYSNNIKTLIFFHAWNPILFDFKNMFLFIIYLFCVWCCYCCWCCQCVMFMYMYGYKNTFHVYFFPFSFLSFTCAVAILPLEWT